MTRTFEWDEDKVQELLQLVSEGHSFGRIAHIMGASSRNIPLCKFNRLRMKDPALKHPHSQTFRRAIERPKVPKTLKLSQAPKLVVVKADEIVPLDINGAAITIETVNNKMCRYPYGDPGQADFRLCGHALKLGSPYCEAHHRQVYNQKPTKTADRSGRKRFSSRGGHGANRGFSSDSEY